MIFKREHMLRLSRVLTIATSSGVCNPSVMLQCKFQLLPRTGGGGGSEERGGGFSV
jgi:hypothetical protein